MNAYPVIGWKNWMGASPGPAVTHPADADGYPFANLSDWREYTEWRTGETGALEIKLDAGGLDGGKIAVDCFALAGHNLASAGAADIGLYSSDNDADYSACFPAFTPASDRPQLRSFAARDRRYFKLVIPAGYTPPIQLGILFIGRALTIPAYPDAGFDPDVQEAELAAERSRSGYLLGVAPRSRRREVSAGFGRLPAAFIAEEWAPFFSVHGWRPFFFAWDPVGHPEEVYLLRLTNPRLSAPFAGAFRSLSLEMTGPAD